MKNLKELQGVKLLTKNEQKLITGGFACAWPGKWCPSGSICCKSGEFEGFCRTKC